MKPEANYAHTHFFDKEFTPEASKQYGAEKVDLEDYKSFFSPLFKNKKKCRLNLFANPDKAMCDLSGELLRKSDSFLLKELNKDSANVGEIIVLPGESIDDLEKRLVHPNIKGFKCYHIFADKEITWNCTIDEYLPESVWQLANERKMCITLHMVKDKALADEENLKYICAMAQKYKDATLILAHAARSFAAWTAIESVEKVKHLENLWFDFSGVCESPAMFQILRKVGVGRCMWGSDFPVCVPRGKAISFADAFYWIYQRDIDNFDSKTVVNNWLKGDYINIHYCQSDDNGRTFGPMIDTGLSGQPGNVIDGKNGTLITVYINRDNTPIIRLAESRDHGKTWKDVLTVYEYEKNTKGKQNNGMNDVWAEMAMFSIGHPFMKRMQDGTIWVYFYNGPATDRTDFCYVQIEE